MERMTAYSWYLFYASSLLLVMRWVIRSIGLAPPPSPLPTEQDIRNVVDRGRPAKGHNADPEDSCSEASIPSTVRQAEERSANRARMIEAWASRCRLVPVDKDTDIQSAVKRLLDGQSRGLLVVDGRSGDTVGVLQERDLVRALGEHGVSLGRMRIGELVDMPR